MEKELTARIVINSLKSIFQKTKNGYGLIFTNNIIEENKMCKRKEKLFSEISHELRTPLTIIRGYIEILLQTKITDEQREYLEIILRNELRLEQIYERFIEKELFNSVSFLTT
ncbi:MAG: histidine kinase dimerization/phospho-acceptor domain-containing protein [Candidatus Helarchaeota archaeon]